MKVLAITGYKPFELGIFKQDDKALYYIKKAIKNRLIAFLDEGLEWILISSTAWSRAVGGRSCI